MSPVNRVPSKDEMAGLDGWNESHPKRFISSSFSKASYWPRHFSALSGELLSWRLPARFLQSFFLKLSVS